MTQQGVPPYLRKVPGRQGYVPPPLDVWRDPWSHLPAELLRQEARSPEMSGDGGSASLRELESTQLCRRRRFTRCPCTMKYNPKINEVVAQLPVWHASIRTSRN